MSGPEATASPLTAPPIPNAIPRLAAGTAAVSRASVNGIMIAAPTPCTARAAIRESMPGAMAAPAEAPVKIAIPTRLGRLGRLGWLGWLGRRLGRLGLPPPLEHRPPLARWGR